MRFIMTARPGENSKPVDPNAPIDEKLFSDYMAFNEALHTAGVLVAAEGLNPAGKGARVEVKKGKRAVVDGPFTESKELVVASTSSRCRRSTWRSNGRCAHRAASALTMCSRFGS